MSNKAIIREEAKKLNPIDDVMFCKMAEDRAVCQEIIRAILEEPDLVVLENTVQWIGKNLQGRSVQLDTKCQLTDGRIINVEVQKSDNDDHQKRVRYHGSILTTNVVDPGRKFENIPNVTVIYISRFDVFEKERTTYHVDRVIRETGEPVNNGFTEVYVNTKVDDGSEISELMRLFNLDNAYSEKFPAVSERKRLFKGTEKGQQSMSEVLQTLMDKERQEGIDQGRMEESERNDKLTIFLLQNNRIEDLKRSCSDKTFKNQLIAELFPDSLTK